MEDLWIIPDQEFHFHFKSGRPSIDFVTTVGERWRRSFERLREPSDLGRWFVESEILGKAPRVSPALLREAHELRESIYRTTKLAGRGRPALRDLDAINAWAAKPSLIPRLGSDRSVEWHSSQPARAGLAFLARDAIDLIASPLGARVKECERDDCALLFVDSSRPGSRRWCSMDGCGNKTKTAAYRRRAGAR